MGYFFCKLHYRINIYIFCCILNNPILLLIFTDIDWSDVEIKKENLPAVLGKEKYPSKNSRIFFQ